MKTAKRIENEIQHKRDLIEIVEKEIARTDIDRTYREDMLMQKYKMLHQVDELKAELDELQ